MKAASRAAIPGPAGKALGDELLAKAVRGLGDPTRLRILRYLLEELRTVGDVVAYNAAHVASCTRIGRET